MSGGRPSGVQVYRGVLVPGRGGAWVMRPVSRSQRRKRAVPGPTGPGTDHGEGGGGVARASSKRRVSKRVGEPDQGRSGSVGVVGRVMVWCGVCDCWVCSGWSGKVGHIVGVVRAGADRHLHGQPRKVLFLLGCYDNYILVCWCKYTLVGVCCPLWCLGVRGPRGGAWVYRGKPGTNLALYNVRKILYYYILIYLSLAYSVRGPYTAR